MACSNTVVVLQVEDETELADLEFDLRYRKGFKLEQFYEFDLDDEMTAVAVLPHPEVGQHLAHLRLANSDLEQGCANKRRERQLRIQCRNQYQKGAE